MKKTTVVTVTWNSAPLLPALTTVLEALAPSSELLVSDNASTDGSPVLLRGGLPGATVLDNPRNGGFGYGNNRALERCTTPYVLLLNADASIGPSHLSILEKALEEDNGIAAVQPLVRLWGWPRVTLSAGTAVTRFGEGYDLDYMRFQAAPRSGLREVPGVTAAVSLWRREALEAAGGFDENFFMYFEDVDLCMRLASMGYSFLLAPSAHAEHMSGASSTRREALEWELFSSILLSRRFLSPDCRHLPPGWMSREWRIRLSLIRNGRCFGWRRRTAAKAMSVPLERVELPPDVLQRLTWELPDRMPVRRPIAPTGSLDADGGIESGPGWLPSGLIDDCGFACAMIGHGGETALFRLENCGDVPGSVALWSDDGLEDRGLAAPGDEFLLSCVSRSDRERLYIVPDRRDMRIGLVRAELSGSG